MSGNGESKLETTGSNIRKGAWGVVALIVTLIFVIPGLAVFFGGGVYSLIGLNERGMDVAIGNMTTKFYQDLTTGGFAAAKNMFGDTGQLMGADIKEALPDWDGKISIKGQNFDLCAAWGWFCSDGSQPGGDQPGNDQPDGDQPGDDQPGGEPTEPVCKPGISAQVAKVQQTWGSSSDYEEIMQVGSRLDKGECAAQALIDGWLAPLAQAVEAMKNSPDLTTFESNISKVEGIHGSLQITAYAKKTVTVAKWLEQKPWTVDPGSVQPASEALKGVQVNSGQTSWEWANARRPEDKFALKLIIQAGAWEIPAELTRQELEAFQKLLGTEELLKNEFWGKNDKGRSVDGGKFKVPGDVIDFTPVFVPSPDLDEFANPEPEPTSTPAPTQAAPAPTTIQCVFNPQTPQGKMHLDEWVVNVVRMDWGAFLGLNPGSDGRSQVGGTYSITGTACP
jgi:hypothetical protein